MTAETSYHDRDRITVVFDTDEPKQVETLHSFRAAFGKQSDLESLNESVIALHIRPGHLRYLCDRDAT